ncbi:HTH-type transcriptional activator Btr [compost metagenome]
MTPQYISAVYKKSSGQNLTDYVAEVRIREAKKLLTHPSMTIAQVAEKVGYANDIGFIRFFKKYEGITPGAYRSSLQMDK